MTIRIIRSSIKERTIFFSHSGEDPHDQSGLEAQDHQQERAALHGLDRRRLQTGRQQLFFSLPLLVGASSSRYLAGFAGANKAVWRSYL
jgi:hypothetical protein